MREYKLPVWAKLLMGAICVGLLIGAFFMTKAMIEDSSKIGLGIFVLLVIATVISALVIATVNWHLSVTEDEIVYRDFLKFKRVGLKQILGYRIEEKNFIIEPNDSRIPILTISKTFDGSSEFESWLRENYKDLVAERIDQEEEEILDNETYGSDRHEREQRLEQARYTAKWLNGAGAVILLWGFLYPEPLPLVMAASAICPLVAMYYYRQYGGLMRFTSGDKSAYVSLGMAVMPVWIIAMRALLDFQMWDYRNIFIGTAVVAAAGAALFFSDPRAVYKTENSGKGILVGVIIYGLIYGYGINVFANCYFDKDEGLVYEAKVLSKRISRGKHTSYDLRVAPWGPQTTSEEISVSRGFYHNTNDGDNVHMTLRSGTWLTLVYDLSLIHGQ